MSKRLIILLVFLSSVAGGNVFADALNIDTNFLYQTNTVQIGLNATNQTIRLVSSADPTCFTVTTNNAVSWLIVSNGDVTYTGPTEYLISVAYSNTLLSAGTHTGVLDVATSDSGGWTTSVHFALNVISLLTSPTNFASSVLAGCNPTNHAFNVSAGWGSMAYTATTDDGGYGWLSVSPTSGTASYGITNALANTYSTASLAAGEYGGNVSVISTLARGVTNTVGVTMTVLPGPVLGFTPGQIRQVVDKGTSPTSDAFEVWNDSAAPALSLAYRVSATNDAGIIQGLSPSDGIVSGQHATVGIFYENLSEFEAGVYTAVVEVAMTNYGVGYEGCWSGTTNVTVLMEISGPESPSLITATKGEHDDKVALNWAAVISPMGKSVTYQVLRHTTFDQDYAQTIVSGLTVTNIEDTSAYPGTRYYYWVRCVNEYGYSGTNSVPDSGYRRLNAPGGLFASDGAYTNKVMLSWADVDGAAGYYVYRKTGGAIEIVQHTAGTEFEDNLVTDGVEYTYYVQSTNGVGGSLLSAGEVGYVLGKPTVVSASDGGYVGKVVLTWDAVKGATAYEVWRSTQTLTPPYGGGAKVTEMSATTYEDTSVTAGQKYHYWLKAKNATAVSSFSGREDGFSALAAVDLSLSGLLIQPRRIGVGEHPAVVSFRLRNNGGGDLTGDNGFVCLTFYASGNSVFGDGDETVIGSVDERLELGIGLKEIFRVGGGNLTLPSEAGRYFLFMKLNPVWPSSLAPSVAGGWVVGRAGSLEVSPYGSINYQALNDYDGDGMSDLVTHGSGVWDGESVDGIEYAREYAFGGAGAAVMGDYDGDRKSDPLVYDESRGYWRIMLSGSAYRCLEGWFGGPGYRAAPGDYDGDGKTEVAVYDENNALWYALKIGDGRVMWELPFGSYGYEPVTGDYDGDGIWDLAVYDESRGLWYIRTVSGTLLLSGAYWGGEGFRPVAGDYDGDGIWDLAVYDNATGRWYIETVRGEMIADGTLWGAAGYRPVAGDFDGDGVSDLAVYNSTLGKWFIRTVGGSWLLLDGNWSGAGRRAVGEVE